MEIVINLEPWPDDSPVSHDSTRFIVKNETKIEILSDIITGLVYVKEIDIPIGSTYYVVAERRFSLKDSSYDISNINYESEEFVISNNEATISNMLLSKDVIIETPYIFINRDDILKGDETTFTIKSSKYKGSGDGHTHTHWLIKNGDTILKKSLTDKINKTSLTIEKSLVSNLSSFEVYCIHCSNNIESEIGKIKITLNTLNFELTNNTISLVSTGVNLEIKRIDNTRPIGLSKILIKHKDEILKILETNPLAVEDYKYILSSTILEIKRDMIIELYGNDMFGELGKKSYVIDMIDNLYNNDSINPNIVYKKQMEYNSYPGKLPIIVSDSYRNFAFVPNNHMLDIYSVTEDGVLTFSKNVQSLSLGLVTNDNIYVKYTDSNYLIVDVKLDASNGDHPRFLIFKHDIYKDTFLLVNIIDRPDELHTVGYNNAIEFVDEETFVYSIYGSNELRKVNYILGTTIKSKEIPETTIDGAMIIKMLDNNLLVLSNKTHKTFIYNVDKDEYRSAMAIPYTQFIGKDLKKVDLANGDKVLVTIDDNTSDGSIAWFDAKDNSLSLLPTKLKTISNNYSIYRKNNENFIAVSKEKDFLTYTEDTILVEKII